MKICICFPVFQALFILGFIACLTSCYKEPLPKDKPGGIDFTVLPAITQNGENTFGCKVNGEIWIPQIPLWDPTANDKSALLNEKNNTGIGNIRCNIIDGTRFESMQVIFGPTYFITGRYYITGNSSTNITFNPGDLNPRYEVQVRDSLSNWIEVSSIDTLRNIASGIFQCTLYNPNNSNDKKVITEGRFDMYYYPQ